MFVVLLTFGQEFLRIRHDLSSALKSLVLERLGVLRHYQVQNEASEFIHPAADLAQRQEQLRRHLQRHVHVAAERCHHQQLERFRIKL